MSSAGFNEKTYALLLRIPKGKVTTYKEIALALGTRAYRAVGNALNRNSDPDGVPCYKVVNSDGRIGGYAKGQVEKIRRLRKDGIEFSEGKIKGFEKRLYKF